MPNLQAPSIFGGPVDLTMPSNHDAIPALRSTQYSSQPGPLHPPMPFIPSSRWHLLLGHSWHNSRNSSLPVNNPAPPSHSLHGSVRNIRQTVAAPTQTFAPHLNTLNHQTTMFSPKSEHASLDTGIEEEENQFVNSDVFAELTLEDLKDTAGSGEAVAYRQVSGDHRNPAFFIRNPSLIYGLTQSGGATFFQRACEIVGYEWPPRLLPL
jgi:hypothetical protein